MKNTIKPTKTVILIALLLLLLIPSNVNAKQDAARCQCVEYVVNKLFYDIGGARPAIAGHSWDTAEEMATADYWSNDSVIPKNSGLQRYQVGGTLETPDPTGSHTATAQAGDVIIMQSEARVYVQFRDGTYSRLITNIGYGAGHIGIVNSAKYTTATIEGKTIEGWRISMESANWDNDYDVDENGNRLSIIENGTLYSFDNTFRTMAGCNNVALGTIFVPSGNPVSFWRLFP
ncbi:MAG: hypothetical protein M1347_02275 [Chloroflexi bacterium]|nr:hypothetical protein [Chloroflexota bacterium]